MEVSNNYLLIEKMIRDGWFLDKSESELADYLLSIEQGGLITADEHKALFDLAFGKVTELPGDQLIHWIR
jgi:hypothetical protein